MPQYQLIDAQPDAVKQAVGNFAQSFSENLRKSREEQRKTDVIDQIFNRQSSPSQNPLNSSNAMNGPSYLGQQTEAPDNLTKILNDVKQHPDTLARQGVVSGPNPEGLNNARVTPQKMAQLKIVAPDVAKALEPVYESQTNKEKEGLKADVKRSTDFLSKIDKIAEGIPRKELALKQIDQAIASGTKLDTLQNQLADVTGLESLRSAKGAQLKSATKEFFLSDLSSIPGVRPNQFLEKALSSAMTDDSRTKEANEMLAAGMRSNLMLDKVRIELTSQIENRYKNQLGYVPSNISKDVNTALAPYAQQIQDQWANEVQHIEEKNNKKIQEFVKVSSDPVKRKAAAGKVPLKPAIPGSVIDKTMWQILLTKYDGDKEKAAQVATERLKYKLPE
jgi:hypothetical protein